MITALLFSYDSISQQDVFYSLSFQRNLEQKETRAFISLSETINADTNRIAYLEEHYLAHQGERYDMVRRTNNYHELLEKNRQLLLENLGLKETDSIYIFSLGAEKSLTYAVKELKLVAFLDSYYTFDHEAYQIYYHIGFEIDKLLEEENKQLRDAWVSIGNKSPFRPEGLQKIILRDIVESEISRLEAILDTVELDLSTKIYNWGDLTFLAFGLEELSSPSSITEVLVLDDLSGKVVYHKAIEFADIVEPLPYGQQYTGFVLEGKPPVLIGFEFHQFGCPEINFVCGEEKPIPIRCDNRQ